jgi:hypothetical protein
VHLLKDRETRCLQKMRLKLLTKYFHKMSLTFTKSLFAKTQRLSHHPIVIFYNDRDR